MAKQRFRDLKQGKVKKQEEKKNTSKKDSSKPNRDYATAGQKIKAFLTDSFMLVMPIIYVVFYLIMDGREGFAAHKMLGWIYILIPLIIIQTIFSFQDRPNTRIPSVQSYAH